MLDHPYTAKHMKKLFPLKSKKWELEWFKPNVYPVIKRLFNNNIDPEILEEIKIDKELSLTLIDLEIEPAMLYVKFMKPLNKE